MEALLRDDKSKKDWSLRVVINEKNVQREITKLVKEKKDAAKARATGATTTKKTTAKRRKKSKVSATSAALAPAPHGDKRARIDEHGGREEGHEDSESSDEEAGGLDVTSSYGTRRKAPKVGYRELAGEGV